MNRHERRRLQAHAKKEQQLVVIDRGRNKQAIVINHRGEVHELPSDIDPIAFALAAATGEHSLPAEHAGDMITDPQARQAFNQGLHRLVKDITDKHGMAAFQMPKHSAAIHEAGHCVIDTHHGIRVKTCWIEMQERYGAEYWGGYTETFGDQAPFEPAEDPEGALIRAQVTYAGLVAECLFDPESREGSSLDELLLAQWLIDTAAKALGRQGEDLHREEWHKIATVLQRYQNVGHSIAEALMAKHRLDGPELATLLAPIPAIHR